MDLAGREATKGVTMTGEIAPVLHLLGIEHFWFADATWTRWHWLADADPDHVETAVDELVESYRRAYTYATLTYLSTLVDGPANAAEPTRLRHEFWITVPDPEPEAAYIAEVL